MLNILNNARQAIETHEPGGRISITTGTDGAKVRMVIQDNGPGIPKEILPRIFNPFFTTKGVGKGTGLGLSLCYGIIKEHGGNIIPDEPARGRDDVYHRTAGGGGRREFQPTVSSSARAGKNRRARRGRPARADH